MIDCSIIIPVYFNENSLEKLYHLICSEVIEQNSQFVFETIFVNDGSGDNSLNILLSIKESNKDKNITVINLTRNFGQPHAAFAGLNNAKGRCFVYLSADIQEPPELINEMLKFHFEEKYEIVIGTPVKRNESYYRKITSGIFYRIVRKIIFSNMPKVGFAYGLHGLKIKNFILNNFDANPFTQGMLLWTGYKIKELTYIKIKRESGSSRWTFSKQLKYFIDSILSYSYFPIRIITATGFFLTLIGLIILIIYFFPAFLGNLPFNNLAPVMILILVLSGIQLLMLGIIGEYLWRTFSQLKFKQAYIIDEIYD